MPKLAALKKLSILLPILNIALIMEQVETARIEHLLLHYKTIKLLFWLTILELTI